MAKWFDNPRKKRRRKKRRPPKGGWKKYMAKLRRMKGRKHKGGSMARRKRRRRAHNRRRHRVRGHVTRKHHRVRAHMSNRPRRRHRYRRRHNPRFTAGGLMRRVQNAAVDGVWVVGGKAVTNMLPSLLGLAPTGWLGLGMKAVAAVVAGYLFGFISPNAGKLAAASGFASIYEPYLKGLPIIGPALADDEYGAYPLYGAYPEEIAAPGVGAYPEQVGVGVDEDAAAMGMY